MKMYGNDIDGIGDSDQFEYLFRRIVINLSNQFVSAARTQSEVENELMRDSVKI